MPDLGEPPHVIKMYVKEGGKKLNAIPLVVEISNGDANDLLRALSEKQFASAEDGGFVPPKRTLVCNSILNTCDPITQRLVIFSCVFFYGSNKIKK